MAINRQKRIINGKEQWCYTYDFYLAGRRIRTPRDSYFPTRGECEDAVNTIKADHRRGIYKFPADRKKIKLADVRAYVEKILKSEGKAQPYIDRITQSLKVLESITPSHLGVSELKTEHLENFIESQKKTGLKDSTIRNKINCLIVAFNMATHHFDSLEHWQPPKRPRKMLEPDGGRDRIITPEEEEKIIAAFKMPCKRNSPFHQQVRIQGARIFWLALRTGLREGEIIALRKSSVHFERGIHMRHGYIDVRATGQKEKTKTKRNRLIPMTSTVAHSLNQWIAESPSDFVFSSPYFKNQPVTVFRIAFREAVERAGLLYGRETRNGIIFHDTRHTAATRMLQAGASVRDVADILGHSNTFMTLRYVHSTPATKQAAIDKLEDKTLVQLESIAARR